MFVAPLLFKNFTQVDPWIEDPLFDPDRLLIISGFAHFFLSLWCR
jgi:hypothetical protein